MADERMFNELYAHAPTLPASSRGHADHGHRPQPLGSATMTPEHDRRLEWMELALGQARAALETADVPIGAVVVGPDGTVLGTGRNEREATGDPTAHAEVLALRQAAAARRDAGEADGWRLADCTLVATLEPCAMCAGALVLARIPRLVFGAWDPKAGACGSVFDVVREPRLNHWVEVFGGVREAECAALLTDFFSAHRGRD